MMTPTINTTSQSVPVGFAQRHIGLSPDDIQEMLTTVDASSLEQLIDETLPDSIRQAKPLEMGEALSETQVLTHLRQLASRNKVITSLLGMGYHGTILPGVIQRNVLENPAWYTAYTPYQPEISQGRLEALLNYQTMICDLTGLDVANASLLDEATAAAEAMALARRMSKSASMKVFVDRYLHPQTIAVLKTRAEPLGWTLVIDDADALGSDEYFCGIFQYPDTYGSIRDFQKEIAMLHAKGGLAALACDPLALALLTPPGELGADIAIGSAQRFGVPMGFGGPHAAYMAVKDALKRSLPGRLVGVSVDTHGNPAYRLSLQAREQHIRREKATSNICTAQVLLAVIASFYAVYHGPQGLTEIARGIRRKTAILAAGLERLGYRRSNTLFFDTLAIPAGGHKEEIMRRALLEGLNFRRIAPGECDLRAAIGISLDETTTPETIEAIWRAFGGNFRYEEIRSVGHTLPVELVRTSKFLTHPVFHSHRSETEMLRYIRRLSDRDLALDRAMIPLGSCTMKLNATTEMVPISWPEWNSLHPFVPRDQAEGYYEVFRELEQKLCAITGYDAVSLQPNSGAQGEYAGLLAIRAYHRSRGEANRNVCLIPSSAHGTNPASAHMAGMEVEVVSCDEHGNVDIADLTAKAEQHSANLAAVMVTYPSTHGVFEEGIREICSIVHRHGGQVYLDGANLNAQVGLARPGEYGADVSHINLHKTFCIPHGGGGPGMGPIGVKAHLKPFLPGHFTLVAETGGGPVSAAAFGSASILLISYAYMLLMAGEGLRAATQIAILSANYVAKKLSSSFPLLYKNRRGRVAHECILDPREFKDSAGVSVDDIAKRLIDYGFHAPTMSFPVPGTLMIEPTESESKYELDRFCDAMTAIRQEIDDIAAGKHSIADSPLRNAPHTALDLASNDWGRGYSRTEGCFPGRKHGEYGDKYWPPVGRIDHVAGDRNLVCSCPPMDSYR